VEGQGKLVRVEGGRVKGMERHGLEEGKFAP